MELSPGTTEGVESISVAGQPLLIGDVTLSAGSNVTLLQTGNDIRISSIGAVSSVFGRTGAVVAVSGDYTTALVPDSLNKRYVTDAQLTVLGNTSGINTGNQTTSGTTNRITVATGSTNPVIDIAATYVGQTSITTLGTVATGTWSGTTIAANKGGTGIALYTMGDMLYANTTTTLARISPGFDGQVLTINTGMPFWADAFIVSEGYGITADLTDGTLTIAVTANALTEYLLLAGRTGGQIAKGGTAATDTLTLVGTSGNGTAASAAILLKVGNNGGTTAATLLNNGQLGIGQGTPTAVVHIGASTTSRASMRLDAGPAPTSPNEGDMWADSTQKAIYMYADGVKQSGPGVLFTQTADATVTNTVTETSVLGTGIGTKTLPANFLVAGKTIRIRVGGIYSTPALGATATIKVKYGSTVLATKATTSLFGGAAGLEFDGEVLITCRTTGVSGTVVTHGDIEYATGVTGTIAVDPLNNGGAATTINTTTSNALDVTLTWDSATTTRIATSTISTIEVLN